MNEDFERELADALGHHADRAQLGHASIGDVHRRARRRVRRRTTAGVGALVAVGAVGIVAATAGDSRGPRFASDQPDAEGDAAGPLGETLWRCTGPVDGPMVSTLLRDYNELLERNDLPVDPTVPPDVAADTAAATTTMVSVVESTSTLPPATTMLPPMTTVDFSTMTSTTVAGGPMWPQANDGAYYMTHCEPIALETADTVVDPTAPTTVDGPVFGDPSTTSTEVQYDTTTSTFVEDPNIAPTTTAAPPYVGDLPGTTTTVTVVEGDPTLSTTTAPTP